MILATDPLSTQPFSKSWPLAGSHFQSIAHYALDLVQAVAVIAVVVSAGLAAARASGNPRWRRALTGIVPVGLAVLMTAGLRFSLPARAAYPLLTMMAAVLVWFGVTRIQDLPRRVSAAGPRVRAGRSHGSGAADSLRDGRDQGQDRYHSGGEYGPEDGYWPDHHYGPGDGHVRERQYGADDRGVSDGQHVGDGRDVRDGRDVHDSRDVRDGMYATCGQQETQGPGDLRSPLGPSDLQGPGGLPEPGRSGRSLNGVDQGRRANLGADPLARQWQDWQRGAGPGAPSADERPAASPGAQTAQSLGAEAAALAGANAEVGAHAKPDGSPAARPARPYGRILIFTLLDDRVADFDRLAEQTAEEVRTGEPDTLVYVIHLVPNAPMQRIFYEIYRDRAAFDSHESQPYMQRFVAERRSCVLATNVIELRLKYAKVAPLQNPQPPNQALPSGARAQLPAGPPQRLDPLPSGPSQGPQGTQGARGPQSLRPLPPDRTRWPDQPRPDQWRSDQLTDQQRPDQQRPDQWRPDQQWQDQPWPDQQRQLPSAGRRYGGA